MKTWLMLLSVFMCAQGRAQVQPLTVDQINAAKILLKATCDMSWEKNTPEDNMTVVAVNMLAAIAVKLTAPAQQYLEVSSFWVQTMPVSCYKNFRQSYLEFRRGIQSERVLRIADAILFDDVCKNFSADKSAELRALSLPCGPGGQSTPRTIPRPKAREYEI